MRKRIRIIICLLVTLCLFADCHTDPPEDVMEPFAPPAREIPASITEIEEEGPPAQPEPSPERPQPAEEPQAITYVLNTNTKKFHPPAVLLGRSNPPTGTRAPAPGRTSWPWATSPAETVNRNGEISPPPLAIWRGV